MISGVPPYHQDDVDYDDGERFAGKKRVAHGANEPSIVSGESWTMAEHWPSIIVG